MAWGRANRPKVSNKLGAPHPRNGSDGDLEVRQTSLGARLFAKIGGRWFSNMLYGTELDSPSIFIPKVWVYKGTLPDFDGGDTGVDIRPPSEILTANVISFSLLARGFQIGSLEGYVLAGDLDDVHPSIGSGAAELTILWRSDVGLFRISGASGTTVFDGEEFILTVFFK